MLDASFLFAALAATSVPQQAALDTQHAQVLERSLDSVYMLGVSRRSETGPEAFEFIGTGWVIEQGKLATNAHVAESLLAKSHEGRLTARRSWSDRDELRLSSTGIRIHPAYAPWNARLKRIIVRAEHDPAAARSMSFIPVADVAICTIEAGTTAAPLPIGDPASVQPALSESIVYLGFPHENLSGFPTAHAVPGHVTAKTDFFFQRAPWSESFLIHWCGPVVGGASGSPMLNRAGQVVGLISASENNLSMNGERTSFGFAYGQRIDLARELLRDDYAKVQAQRDVDWSRRIAKLLLPPEELLAQMAQTRAEMDGIPMLGAAHTVHRGVLRLTRGESATLAVPAEVGYRYGFLAAAHDGSDIDACVVDSDWEGILGEDVESDYFPVVWLGPFEEERSLTFLINADETLLGDTECTVHVYKYVPTTEPMLAEEGVFFRETLQTSSIAGQSQTWRFAVEPHASLMFSATSTDGFDIDLLATLDGVVIASDETPDSVPLMIFETARAGTLELRLKTPQGMPAGSTVELHGLLFSGAPPQRVDEPPPSPSPREFSRAELRRMMREQLDPVFEANMVVDSVLLDERVLVLTSRTEFRIELPDGVDFVFSALTPTGEDLDLEVRINGELATEAGKSDTAPPIAFLKSAERARNATVRLLLPERDARGRQAYFCVNAVDL